MHLQELELIHFKNHINRKLSFIDGTNAIVGPNGIGKTNLLDAIHYLSVTKSYFAGYDHQHIHTGKEFFMVQGMLTKNKEKYILTCSYKKRESKKITVNKKEVVRFFEHIGSFPIVGIFPQDSQIITGHSEERRRFIDVIISHYDKKYLEALMSYNKTLAQRNALLKDAYKNRHVDMDLLELYNQKMVETGHIVYDARKAFFEEFNTLVLDIYNTLVLGKEAIRLIYKSQLNDGLLGTLLTASFDRDKILQHTTIGIHRDDVLLELNGQSVKKFASQGQQKCLLIALKIGQYRMYKKKLGISPIILLDDIFDKLDRGRSASLIQMLVKEKQSQIIITHTDEVILKEIFQPDHFPDVNLISL